jgi:hypothetical protein
MGREQVARLAITVSSGSGTGNCTAAWDLIRWLRIKPIAETDSFDLTIADREGILMLKRTAQVGTFAEKVEMSLGIMGSIAIANATQDGTYQVRFDMH